MAITLNWERNQTKSQYITGRYNPLFYEPLYIGYCSFFELFPTPLPTFAFFPPYLVDCVIAPHPVCSFTQILCPQLWTQICTLLLEVPCYSTRCQVNTIHRDDMGFASTLICNLTHTQIHTNKNTECMEELRHTKQSHINSPIRCPQQGCQTILLDIKTSYYHQMKVFNEWISKQAHLFFQH